jgi:hypothetical protein
MKYRIRSGTLGHDYAVLITFDNKENLDPLIRVIKKAFEHLEMIRKRLQKAKELEEKERKKAISPGGLP